MTTPNALSRRTFMTGLAGAALIGAAGCSPAQQQAQSSATASGSAASATITVRLWDGHEMATDIDDRIAAPKQP